MDFLNNLRALEAVLRTGGLRPAARELGVTPAAVGQHIRNLEDHLGTALMTRHPTGSRPTRQAQEVADTLTRHLQGLQGVLESLAPSRDPNRVSLTVLPEFAENWFPRHLATLFAQVGGIDLRIDTSRALVDLDEGEFDFAVRYSREPSDKFEYELLLDDYCAPVCTAEFAERYDLSSDRASLRDVPLAELDLTALGSSTDLPEMVSWCARYSVTPPDPISGQVVVDYTTARKMARAGLAILLGGIHDFIAELENSDMVLPFGPEKVILNEHKFWLIWRKGLRMSPAQKSFVAWIKNHAAEDRDRVRRILAG